MIIRRPFRNLQLRPGSWRLSSRLLAAELATVLVGWLSYALFGAAVVSFIYHKGLIRPLATAEGDPWMAAHYIERADNIVLVLLAAAALVIVLQAAIWKLWQSGRRSQRTVPASSRARPITSRYRYTIFGALSVALGCSVIVGLLVASNRLFVSQLRFWEEIKVPSFHDLSYPELNERQVMNLGWAHDPSWAPRSSYIYHTTEKPPGTYRIGCFGDSFTEGEESGPGHDFPSFLQEQLRAIGGGKYEVINFGARGYGMQQSYLIYEYLGKRYDLDMAIFMPFKYFYERDNTFKTDGTGGRMHARYVLAGNGFHLVTIDEETRRRVLENYYRLLPPAKYWRYDAYAANLLTTFAHRGNVPRFNPFYYAGWMGFESELPQLYSKMFAKTAEETGKVMVVGNDGLSELFDNSGDKGVSIQKSRLRINSFLVLGPKGHLSALGNRLRAAEITEWMTGQKLSIPVPVILASDNRSTGREESSEISLTDISEGWIEIEGRPVAGFFMHEPSDPFWRFSKKANFAQQGIRAIIQLRAGEKPAEQPVFLPVDFPVEDGALVELRVSSSEGTRAIQLGTVDCIANFLCRARFYGASDIAHLELDRDGRHYKFNAYHRALVRNGYFDGLDILVSGRPVLRGQRLNRFADLARRFLLGRSPEMLINRFNLKPLTADFVFFRAKAGQYVDPLSIPHRGPIQTALRRRDGALLRVGSFLRYVIPES